MSAVKLRIRRKIALVLGLLLFLFAAVIFKLFIIQVIQSEDLQSKAAEDRTRDMVVDAARGTIYDRNGDTLAISITADSVAFRPTALSALSGAERTATAQNVAKTLADILGMEYETVYDLVSSDSSYVYIKRKITTAQAEAIRAAELPGVEMEEESQRYYPKGSLACHVLGFAGIDNQGLEGLELSLDGLLSGTDGRVVGQYDANGNPIPQAEYEYIAPVDGYDVYTTIDENIQYFCERELNKMMTGEYPPKNAGIIVMDPHTCQILAMAVAKNYDPNDYTAVDSSVWRNFLISDSYEPGSVFKIITASTALEEGTVDETSHFYCPGYVSVADSYIGCWSSVPHGSQTLAEAVKNSCNPAFVGIGQTIEAKQDGLFYKYIKAYGFGQLTGIDLPGEAYGLLQDESVVNSVEIATISIGQGIAVTPIQMITAACAVANGGTLMKPQIVSKVTNGSEVIYEAEPEVVRKVVSPDVAAQVRDMMVGVVTDGSGANAAIDGYTIAGKTGTAQKASGGVYASGKYVGSFLGMVPANDPQLVCLVVVDEPSGLYYGSQVAAPVFKAVISDSLRYLGIAPNIRADNSEGDSSVTVPSVTNMEVAEAIASLRDMGLNVRLEGSGSVISAQQPAASASAARGSTVLLTATQETVGEGETALVTVPDLRGRRFSEVANILSVLGLSLSAEGSGEAYSQDPDPGDKVMTGTTVTVKFQ